jgi:hypothetical protein
VYDLLGNPTGEKEKAMSPNDAIIVRKADVVFKVISNLLLFPKAGGFFSLKSCGLFYTRTYQKMFFFRLRDLKPLCRQFSMETPLCTIIYKINPIIQFSVEGEYTDLAVIYLCRGMFIVQYC